MNETNHYSDISGGDLYGSDDTRGGAETTGQSLVRLPAMEITLDPIPTQPNARSTRQLAQRAELANTQEQYKAQLAKTAICNTAALSALANQISDAVPGAEARCKAIVDIYAVSSAAKIARW
jgi:hypothetical protein